MAAASNTHGRVAASTTWECSLWRVGLQPRARGGVAGVVAAELRRTWLVLPGRAAAAPLLSSPLLSSPVAAHSRSSRRHARRLGRPRRARACSGRPAHSSCRRARAAARELRRWWPGARSGAAARFRRRAAGAGRAVAAPDRARSRCSSPLRSRYFWPWPLPPVGSRCFPPTAPGPRARFAAPAALRRPSCCLSGSRPHRRRRPHRCSPRASPRSSSAVAPRARGSAGGRRAGMTAEPRRALLRDAAHPLACPASLP